MNALAVERARTFLQPAYDRETRPLYRQSDVEALIASGRFRLHVGERSAIVTELDASYPSGEVALSFLHCGGDLDEIARMHDRIEREARQQGATQSFIHGRPWGRHARERGYARWSTIVRKVL